MFAIFKEKKGKRFVSKIEKFNIKRMIAPAIQLVSSIVLFVFINLTNMVPDKYMTIIAVVLLVLLLLTTIVQFMKVKWIRIFAIALSGIITVMSVISVLYVQKINGTISNITGANYKINDMLVLTHINDKAEDLVDVENYDFGVVETIDRENTDYMVEEIETQLKQSIKKTEYDNFDLLATALIEGEVEAIVINRAFLDIISIENFSDLVKEIYQFGVKIELATPTPAPTKDPTDDKDNNGEDVNSLTISEKPFAIYISGIDTYGKISTTSRSDVNMIMVVNPTSKQILLVNTPRDYYVELQGNYDGKMDKLTHAGNYGVDISMLTLENLYDVELNYFVKVNFTSLQTIVDALGGIDVHSDYSFWSIDGYYFDKGMNNLNGKEALSFSRERKAFNDGDNQRGKNQQAVISAIIDKVSSPSILTGFDKILSSVESCVQTSMTTDEMNELIKLQLDEGIEWEINSVSAVGFNDAGYCYSLGTSQTYSIIKPDYDSVEEVSQYIDGIFDGKTFSEIDEEIKK